MSVAEYREEKICSFLNAQSLSFLALMVLLEDRDTKVVPMHWCCAGDTV